MSAMINEIPLDMIINTGASSASSDIVDETVYHKVNNSENITQETELVTDVSPSGLSTNLIQNTPDMKDIQVVAFGSRTLTDIERRYSQREREALAVALAIEKLHLYLFGSHFKLLTDYKAFNNPKSKSLARIEHENLRLQGYAFEVQYTKVGLGNISILWPSLKY